MNDTDSYQVYSQHSSILAFLFRLHRHILEATCTEAERMMEPYTDNNASGKGAAISESLEKRRELNELLQYLFLYPETTSHSEAAVASSDAATAANISSNNSSAVAKFDPPLLITASSLKPHSNPHDLFKYLQAPPSQSPHLQPPLPLPQHDSGYTNTIKNSGVTAPININAVIVMLKFSIFDFLCQFIRTDYPYNSTMVYMVCYIFPLISPYFPVNFGLFCGLLLYIGLTA